MEAFVWRQDYTALIVSYAYVFGVIGLGEVLRRLGHRPVGFTRKFIHIGVGMWAVKLSSQVTGRQPNMPPVTVTGRV